MNECHLCGQKHLLPLIDFGNHPITKHYLAQPSDQPPVWPVKLFFCDTCGFTQLVDSCPPEVIYDDYVTLSAWKFQPQVEHEIDLTRKLTGLGPDANIIEIGCNDAMFLEELASVGYKNLVGVEPSSDAHALAVGKGFEVAKEFLSPELSSKLVAEHSEFDLLISRQNFEHISDLRGVIQSLNILLKPDGYVLIELPNFQGNLRYKDYGLWEEHVNYFTVDTLRYLLALADIEVIHEEIFLFSGESIFVLGKKVEKVTPSLNYLPSLKKQNQDYAKNWPIFQSALHEYLHNQTKSGKKIAVYGAGARTFCFINFTNISKYIDVILDDQFEKQGKFMPGGKIPILSSSALYEKGIDIVLLGVNTENEEKVINKHEKWVSNGGQFWSILPPSDLLLPIWKHFSK